jgi:hypothetical protein
MISLMDDHNRIQTGLRKFSGNRLRRLETVAKYSPRKTPKGGTTNLYMAEDTCSTLLSSACWRRREANVKLGQLAGRLSSRKAAQQVNQVLLYRSQDLRNQRVFWFTCCARTMRTILGENAGCARSAAFTVYSTYWVKKDLCGFSQGK